MKLDDLLNEYREDIPCPAPPAFDLLLQKAATRRKRKQASIVALAAAACLALVWLWPKPQAVEQPAAVAARPGTVAPVPVGAVAPVLSPVRRPARVLQFVALPESRFLPVPSMVEVMRVEVSSARLASFGVFDSGSSPTSMVIADVLVGDDGMARAIRVVNQE